MQDAFLRQKFSLKSPVKLNSLYQSCDAWLNDHETKRLLGLNFDLMIIDGAFPECALGLQFKFNVPFMYINTVGFYTEPLSRAGSPVPYAITPYFVLPFTDDMSFFERVINAVVHFSLQAVYKVRIMEEK
jgi:hypothetical protein